MNNITETQKLTALELIIINHMSRFTAIDMMRIYKRDANELINWHEFSDFLACLENHGVLKIVGHNTSGMCEYSLKS